MRKRINVKAGLWLLAGLLGLAQFALPIASADDLKGLRIPAYRSDGGYGLGVTEYSLESSADLLEGEAPEHSIELSALLQPPDNEDVLCFGTTLFVKSVEDDRGRDILRPQRQRGKSKTFNALIPSLAYKDRRGEPLLLCTSELDAIALERPGTAVAEMVVVATAVIVKERESEAIAAEVTDRYTDIGYGTSVQVTSMEIDRKGEMTITLSVKHTGTKDLPVIDSVMALDSRGNTMGGGRWTNELELFGKGYDVELVFPIRGSEKSIDQLRVVLATEYEVEQIEFTIEDLFQG